MRNMYLRSVFQSLFQASHEFFTKLCCIVLIEDRVSEAEASAGINEVNWLEGLHVAVSEPHERALQVYKNAALFYIVLLLGRQRCKTGAKVRVP